MFKSEISQILLCSPASLSATSVFYTLVASPMCSQHAAKVSVEKLKKLNVDAVSGHGKPFPMELLIKNYRYVDIVNLRYIFINHYAGIYYE